MVDADADDLAALVDGRGSRIRVEAGDLAPANGLIAIVDGP